MDKCRIVMVYRNAAFCLISQSVFKTRLDRFYDHVGI